jgi:hypothetical protein
MSTETPFKHVAGVGDVPLSSEEIAALEAAQTAAADEPLPSLEPWQFFAMLDLSGRRADLDAYIEALPEPQRTVSKAKLNHSLVFLRDNDLVLAAKDALGLTDAELDTLWMQARAL